MSPPLRGLARRLLGRGRSGSVSAGYEVLDGDAVLARGWHDRKAAHAQHAAYRELIAGIRDAAPRLDLQVAAEAVRLTGVESPRILEVGCASGYYSEVLEVLLGTDLDYTGLDYSAAMLDLARREYPRHRFVQGDGQRLPLATGSFDIVLNGVSLMHMPDYGAAVAESRRVSRRWCVFHTVPVLRQRPTTRLRKTAYGSPVDEVILNLGELRRLLETSRLRVRHELPSIPYDLEGVLGERTETFTFVCEAA